MAIIDRVLDRRDCDRVRGLAPAASPHHGTHRGQCHPRRGLVRPLHIVVDAASTARWIEFRRLDHDDQPNGVLWTLPVVARTTADRDIPIGRYRISVIHRRGWLPAMASELPTVLEFRNASGQTTGGSLRIRPVDSELLAGMKA